MPPTTIDLTVDSEDITPDPDDPRAQLELELREAKRIGVYLSLSESSKASESRRNVVSRFFKEFWALENADSEAKAKVNPRAEAKTVISTDPDKALDSEVRSGTEQHDDPASGGESGEDDDEERDMRPDPTVRETSYLKRKGYPLNPVCQNCERQFDEDDNHRSGCCRYHNGVLKPALNNDDDYWADTDFAEEHEYSSEHPPDAFQWTCCGGDARADACQSSYHIESSKSKKARDLPVDCDADVHTERLPRPTMDEELQKDVGEKPQEEKIPGPTTGETFRLKRKGYTVNPVCSHCERQFDLDDNLKGCCRYHSGSLEPETSHDYWADCDDPDEMDYDGEEPDAFEWTCCAGNAEADACKSGAHTESNQSKKARLGST